MAPNGPPPRWLKCPRRSELIANKFIAFKTPLDEKYISDIPAQDLFLPSMLLQSVKSHLSEVNKELKLGLWIDLTNTNRFYDKERHVEKAGIKYLKIACRGHGSAPDKDQTTMFIRVCKNFFANHKDTVIGVHCTHGFNRTGFLICSYLVEEEDWSVEVAIQTFANCRTPGIYKSDYIAELFRRYEPDETAPPAPEKPDWCFLDDTDLTDDDGNPMALNGSASGSGDGGNTPKGKKKSKFMEGVEGVELVDDVRQTMGVQEKLRKMCQVLGWNKSKGFPGSQPVSMDRENLNFLAQSPYKVSWKADGTRYLMLIDGRHEVYFFDRDNVVFQTRHIQFPYRKNTSENITNTLVDGEMVIDDVDGKKIARFLIYDILSFRGEPVGKMDFGIRMYCIDKELIGPREEAKQRGAIDRSKEPFGIRKKDFWDISYTRRIFTNFSNNVHEIDGLIFQPFRDPYAPDRCDRILKWKPPSLNSVDFKLKIIQESGAGILPKRVMCLFVGQLDRPFGTMAFKKDLIQYNGKIIECKYNAANGLWEFMRERTDKSFPNAYSTAMGVCESIRNPVTKEYLLDFIDRVTSQQERNLMPPPPPGQGHPPSHHQNGESLKRPSSGDLSHHRPQPVDTGKRQRVE